MSILLVVFVRTSMVALFALIIAQMWRAKGADFVSLVCRVSILAALAATILSTLAPAPNIALERPRELDLDAARYRDRCLCAAYLSGSDS
jgi:hypothetical protein